MRKILLFFFIPYILCSQSLSLDDLKNINSIETFRKVLLENGYKEFNKKNVDQYNPHKKFSYYQFSNYRIYFRPWNNETYTFENKFINDIAI